MENPQLLQKSISQRLKQYLFHINKNETELAKELNISQTALNNATNAKNLPSGKVLIPLAKNGLSIDWLLTGKGKMLQDEESPAVESNARILTKEEWEEMKHLYQTIIEDKLQIITEKDLLIQEKERVIGLLSSSTR